MFCWQESCECEDKGDPGQVGWDGHGQRYLELYPLGSPHLRLQWKLGIFAGEAKQLQYSYWWGPQCLVFQPGQSHRFRWTSARWAARETDQRLGGSRMIRISADSVDTPGIPRYNWTDRPESLTKAQDHIQKIRCSHRCGLLISVWNLWITLGSVHAAAVPGIYHACMCLSANID